MTEIAIVGMGMAVPGASSPGDFWELLDTGLSQFSEPTGNYRLDSFWSADPGAEDRGYVRLSGFLTGLRPHPRLAAEIADGSFQRDDIEAVGLRHSLLQAAEGVATRAGDRVCCVIGGTDITSRRLDEAVVVESAAHQIAAAGLGPAGAPGAPGEHEERLRSRLSAHFGHAPRPPGQLLPAEVVRAAGRGLLPGETVVTVVDTACASSLYAIELGARRLLAGDCDVAYCGGMSGVAPRYNVGFSKLGGLTKRGGPHVFDKDADGTLFSEAAAVVVLKTRARAQADGDRVLGLLAGFGAASDGRGLAICAANPSGQQLCIERAHQAAGLTAGDVDWVIAHGTGTSAGDTAELAALAATAPSGGWVCASNKTVVGHTGWSAGAVSVIHALLALGHGRIPPHHGLDVPAPGSPVGTRIETPARPLAWARRDGRPRTVGVSSFGFGGINGHLLIREDAPGQAATRPATPGEAQADDPVVLVAWAAHLPGDPSRAEAEHMLATGEWTCPRRFDGYAPLPFEEVKVPARTARATDPSQLMAIHLAAMLVAEYGELWAPVRDTTGVIAPSTGPAPLAVSNLLRCYATELEGLFGGEDGDGGEDARALAAFLRDVRAATPPTNRDSLPGIMPNLLPARLANRYDLHGRTMLVNSGVTSGYAALDVAALYLASGELDLVLVPAVNVAVPAGLARVASADPDTVAEGGFLLALTRASVARRHGWPVQAELDRAEISRAAREPGPRAGRAPERTFLAADAAVSLLATLDRSLA
jgi:3-oxoacyl-(acyl-carrier-protein) synthase